MLLLLATLLSPIEFQTVTDAMTDRKTHLVVAPGDGGNLIMACFPETGRMSAMIDSRKYLGPAAPRDEEKAFDYRLDSAPLIQSRWTYAGRQASQSGDQARTFIRAVANADKFAARLYAYDGTQPVVTVNLVPAQAAIAQLLDACTL